MSAPLLGVLGGMGPAAAATFLAKLAERTPATCDQEHLATVLYSDPATPDRSDALLAGGPSPLPAMLAGIAFLERAGAEAIAIPCNTAHAWYGELQAATAVPILHIVDAVATRIDREAAAVSTVGLLATEGTVAGRIYAGRLGGAGGGGSARLGSGGGGGLAVIDLNDLGAGNPVMGGIRAVKAGELARARELLHTAGAMLVERGAEGLVYGCTDVSAALAHPPELGVPVWDSAEALAEACVDRFYDRKGAA